MHRPISLYLKACGTSVKAFDTMSALGVTLTQKWALKAVEKLAKNKMNTLHLEKSSRLGEARRGYDSPIDRMP